MINILKNMTSIKPDILFFFIKKLTYHCYSIFIYTLSFQANIPKPSK